MTGVELRDSQFDGSDGITLAGFLQKVEDAEAREPEARAS